MGHWFNSALTHDQQEALWRYQEVCCKAGKSWKQELEIDWDRAGSSHVSSAHYDQLHGLRSTIGPRMFSDVPVFELGDGVSYCNNGDRTPGTVRKMDAQRIWMSLDKFRPRGSVAYSEDTVGVLAVVDEDFDLSECKVFTRRKTGDYMLRGQNFGFLVLGRKYSRNPHI